jgi:hypothetical protein
MTSFKILSVTGRTTLGPARVLNLFIFKTGMILRLSEHFILKYTFVLQVTIVTEMMAEGWKSI